MLFLIGFMAAGKSSVGKALAAATGRTFVDLDDRIAPLGDDEAAFRAAEAEALQAVIAEGGNPVVATGGGAATFGDNLDRMRAAGNVVALDVDIATAEQRASAPGQPHRPLLAKARELLAARAPIYRRAHAVVPTAGRTIEQVVNSVRHVERVRLAFPGTVVALDERSYAVTVTPELDRFSVQGAIADRTRIAIITDGNVARHHLANLLGDLRGPRPIDTITIEPGEASKSFAVYQQLTEELVRRGFDRKSVILALGGGVVGDLAGFVAATLFRGIPVIQIPTTIVAMTDAAIGGKTAIDLPAGKNLVGAFHQPRLVACGLSTLATLPGRERRAGFGELWKYALLGGEDVWGAIEACTAYAAGPELAPPPPELVSAIERAIAYKTAVVGADERELTGRRALLNLGHTIGHAIEAATGMLHGEAVALGLIAACRMSAALGHASLEARVTDALARSGCATDLDRYLTDDILARVAVDKKRTGATVSFITITGVGACEPHAVTVTDLIRILRRPTSA